MRHRSTSKKLRQLLERSKKTKRKRRRKKKKKKKTKVKFKMIGKVYP